MDSGTRTSGDRFSLALIIVATIGLLLLVWLSTRQTNAASPVVTLKIKAITFQPEGSKSFEATISGKDELGNQSMTPLVAPTIGVRALDGVVPDGSVVSCKTEGDKLACRVVVN